MISTIAAACGMLSPVFDPEESSSEISTIPIPEPPSVPEVPPVIETTPDPVPPQPTPESFAEIMITPVRTETIFTLNGVPADFHAYEIENHIFLDIFELSAALSDAAISTTEKLFNPRWNENRDTLYIESGSRFVPENTSQTASQIPQVSYLSNYTPRATPIVITVFLDENTVNIPAFFITDTVYFALYELMEALDLILSKDTLGNKINIFTNQQAADAITRRNRIDPELPMVALTFDDGPGKLTEQFLDVLEKYDVVATFYVIGRQVKSNSETVMRAFDMGNEIANHTWSHVSMEKASAGTIRKQLQDTNNAVEAVTGVAPVSMRPPFGAVNSNARNVIREFDMPVVLWSIDPSDYLPRSPYNIYSYIMERITDRDIILLHDIHERSLETIKTLIPSLQSKGYQFVTVSELMYFSDVTPEPGKIYRHTRP